MTMLLDTHLLLWAAGDPDRLPTAAKSFLEDRQNKLMFSPASLWEIATKRGLVVRISVWIRGSCGAAFSTTAIL
jgi:PIN domain nuclease of toxin-antitoxin system